MPVVDGDGAVKHIRGQRCLAVHAAVDVASDGAAAKHASGVPARAVPRQARLPLACCMVSRFCLSQLSGGLASRLGPARQCAARSG